jgi:hypothetical protein
MAFTVIVNMPGFLPDDTDELVTYETLADARKALREELDMTAERMCKSRAALREVMDMDAATAEPGDAIQLAGYVHTIEVVPE